MYIFGVLEIESIIFSYLDQIADWNNLKLINNYYSNLLDNDSLKDYIPPANLHRYEIINTFVDACRSGYLKHVKYVYYNHNLSDEYQIDEFLCERQSCVYEDCEYYCEEENQRTCKWLDKKERIAESLDKKITYRYMYNDNAFFISCVYGYLDIAKWLFKLDKNVDAENYVSAFYYSCHNGHLDVAKWLFELNKLELSDVIDMQKHYIEVLFCCYYCNNNLDIIKWLSEIGVDIIANNEAAFIHSCESGHLEIAKWLYEFSNGEIKKDIREDKDLTFMRVCKKGHLDVAKWLLDIDNNIDIHAYDEYAFACSCENGHLEVAKWLLSLGELHGKINIHANDDYALLCSYENGHLEVAKWLNDICDED